MKKHFYSTLAFLFLLLQFSLSQTTITLQPDAANGKDAYIDSYSNELNSNFGLSTELPALTWTVSAVPYSVRSLINFNLSAVLGHTSTKYVKIARAYLSLYAIDNATVGFGQHSSDIQTNKSYIQKITSAWDENTVTWATQPTTSTTNMVALAATTTASQNFENIDVTLLVQDMLDDPGNNFGFMLKLQNEVTYNRINFASSDHANASLRPKLDVSYYIYDIDSSHIDSLVLQPATGKDATLMGYYTNNDINSGDDTALGAGISCYDGTHRLYLRGLIEFDLSSIPVAAPIDSAFIWLYAHSSSAHIGIGEGGADNSCYLQRITKSWVENTVTHANQPLCTGTNMVSIPATTSPNQNLERLNVTALVRDMVKDPANSYGFRIIMKNEVNYPSLVGYCSSDYSDVSRHPKIAVYYRGTSITSIDNVKHKITKVFPNPSNGIFNIELENSGNTIISVYTISGILMKKIKVNQNLVNMNLSGYAKGVYIVKIQTNNQVSTQKIKIE